MYTHTLTPSLTHSSETLNWEKSPWQVNAFYFPVGICLEVSEGPDPMDLALGVELRRPTDNQTTTAWDGGRGPWVGVL